MVFLLFSSRWWYSTSFCCLLMPPGGGGYGALLWAWESQPKWSGWQVFPLVLVAFISEHHHCGGGGNGWCSEGVAHYIATWLPMAAVLLLCSWEALDTYLLRVPLKAIREERQIIRHQCCFGLFYLPENLEWGPHPNSSIAIHLVGAMCSAAASTGHHPCFSWVSPPMLFQYDHHQTYQCVDLPGMCGEQRNLCWIIDVWLVVDVRGDLMGLITSPWCLYQLMW